MEEERKERKKYGSKKNKKKRTGMIVLLLLGILVVLLAIGWLLGNRYFQEHYAYGTTINGSNVFRMTEDEVKNYLSSDLDSYSLDIIERTGDGGTATEKIQGSEIGLKLTFDDSLDRMLEKQNGIGWIRAVWEPVSVQLEKVVEYDTSLWNSRIDHLQCFQDSFVVKPKDAALSKYQEGVGYTIIEEVPGNQPKKKDVEEAIREAIVGMESVLDLNTLDCYHKPAITKDDAVLVEKKEALERYTSVEIVYDFGDTDEVVNGDLIHQWIIVDDDSNITLDKDKIADFVATLRKRYDTIFRRHSFDTSYGEEVSLDAGDYGWWMNYTQEAEELEAMIMAGESGPRTPVYYQTANSYGEHDYGDTYIEVNLTAQHLFYYKDGEIVLESDFVSGNSSRGHDTPEGIYGITYKDRYATLVGEDYETPVSYWMPFNENVGLHDATWRYSFGNNIYKSSGSHGCINLPYAKAKELYGMVTANTPVICYNLDGTESDGETSQSNEDIAQSAIDAIDAIGEVTKDSKKAVMRAREIYEELNGTQKSYVHNYDVLKSAEATMKELGVKLVKDPKKKKNEE